MVQWLGLGALTARGPGSIPGQGTKILQAMWHGQKPPKKQKRKNKNIHEITDLVYWLYFFQYALKQTHKC